MFLPGESHRQRSLVGYSPWGHEEMDMTERLHFHFSLSCIGEGNGNPLQCSCLENPRDSQAWWAAVYGVAQSWTRLKWLSSSSSSSIWLSWVFVAECGLSLAAESGGYSSLWCMGFSLWGFLFLLGKSHGQRSLAGYSPQGRKESDTTEWLTLSLFTFFFTYCGSQALGHRLRSCGTQA